MQTISDYLDEKEKTAAVSYEPADMFDHMSNDQLIALYHVIDREPELSLPEALEKVAGFGETLAHFGKGLLAGGKQAITTPVRSLGSISKSVQSIGKVNKLIGAKETAGLPFLANKLRGTRAGMLGRVAGKVAVPAAAGYGAYRAGKALIGSGSEKTAGVGSSAVKGLARSGVLDSLLGKTRSGLHTLHMKYPNSMIGLPLAAALAGALGGYHLGKRRGRSATEGGNLLSSGYQPL